MQNVFRRKAVPNKAKEQQSIGAVGKGEAGGGASEPQHFLEQKFFFHVKSWNIKFLHANNMYDFSLFIVQDISYKK